MSSSGDIMASSAEAYLQTYMDDPTEAKARALEGIPHLITLLSHDSISVHKNACGALRNLSYGCDNDDNKRAIKNNNGIPELIRLSSKTTNEDILESVTGVLWNLSSCQDLKLAIIEDGLSVLMNVTITKYADSLKEGKVVVWPRSCRNATGIIRNVSSAGFEARKQLRECKGLVNTLINFLSSATQDESFDLDCKFIENAVCILRNLSYRIQEVVDPHFWKRERKVMEKIKKVGCFGSKGKEKSKGKGKSTKKSVNKMTDVAPSDLPPLSIEYQSLWDEKIHMLYFALFRRCTNPITLEATAGAIQNLTACDWQPAVESRTITRREKALPLILDLLSSESDQVICTIATTLRNLDIDEKNKNLIGKYGIPQLALLLPKDNCSNISDNTICAIVATLYELVKYDLQFAVTLMENGLPSLMHINRSDSRYLACTLEFTITLLKAMWSFKQLRPGYAILSYYKSDFTTSTATPKEEGTQPPDTTMVPNNTETMGSEGHGSDGGDVSPAYNTLDRPNSSQGISAQGLDDVPMSWQTMKPIQQHLHGETAQQDQEELLDRTPAECPSPLEFNVDKRLATEDNSVIDIAQIKLIIQAGTREDQGQDSVDSSDEKQDEVSLPVTTVTEALTALSTLKKFFLEKAMVDCLSTVQNLDQDILDRVSNTDTT